MKLSLTTLASLLGFSAAASPAKEITATSKVGQSILSKARRLENNNNNQEVDYTWVANMSLKFQGCFHTQQWNEEANGQDDVRISTNRLIRFRLCPSGSCSMTDAAGCSSGYGDYIIDMETYLQAYLEAVQQDQEYNCEYERQYGDCACDKDGQGDDFNEEICQYDCYMGKGMEYCVDRNPYEEDNGQKREKWELNRMAECQQYKFQNNNNNRKLEDEAKYYVGAYCSENGGSIHLGLFTDDTCSSFADEYGGRETFSTLSYGQDLPYAQTTLVGTECMSCKETQEANNNNENDAEDEDNVKESCTNLYMASGKCEANLDGTVSSPNNYACNYMQGIKIIRKNGAVVRGSSAKNTTASVFIGLFACSFVLLGGYVYYLKTKLDRAKINLSE